jgi:hypothetical protein
MCGPIRDEASIPLFVFTNVYEFTQDVLYLLRVCVYEYVCVYVYLVYVNARTHIYILDETPDYATSHIGLISCLYVYIHATHHV